MAKKKQELSSEELLEQALVREEDWPYQVPGNWVWTRFDKLKESESGFFDGDWILSQNMDIKGEVRLIQLSDIGIGIFLDKSSKHINSEKFEELGCKEICEGDILISRMADPIVRSFIFPKLAYKCITVVDIAVLRCNTTIVDRKFINFLCNTPWFTNFAMNISRGTTRVRITRKNLGELPIPLPPLAEQQRIVDRIESLFDKLDQAKDLIQDALDSFETRKAAILHQAFTGQLTKKWREAHSNIRNTTLHDIKEYAEGLPKKQKNQILNAQEFVKIKELNDGNIWYESTIGAVGLVTNGSTPSRACLEYWNGDIPWVSSGEVRNNIIGFSKECISQKGYENSSVKLLPKGTVLIAMIGEGKTRGQSAVLDIPTTTNQNIAAIIIDHGYISSNFLWYWLQKEYQNNREKGNGTGPQALNCQRVRELKFVLPSFLEQREIVRILDDLFAKEQNAKDLIDLIDQIEAIKKTILGQAFRGELGTNEVGDESAVELLKSIL